VKGQGFVVIERDVILLEIVSLLDLAVVQLSPARLTPRVVPEGGALSLIEEMNRLDAIAG
jgi:hypothetical protein